MRANPSGIVSGVLCANVTTIPKSAPSPDMENYRPISITPILSKMYEEILSQKLSSFWKIYEFFPAAQFAYWKVLDCTNALLTILITSEVPRCRDGVLYCSTRL